MRRLMTRPVPQIPSPEPLALLLERVRSARFSRGPACPRCRGRWIQRWGQFAGRQRYRCRGCRRTFSDLTGTPAAYVKKLGLVATIRGVSRGGAERAAGGQASGRAAEYGVSVATPDAGRAGVCRDRPAGGMGGAGSSASEVLREGAPTARPTGAATRLERGRWASCAGARGKRPGGARRHVGGGRKGGDAAELGRRRSGAGRQVGNGRRATGAGGTACSSEPLRTSARATVPTCEADVDQTGAGTLARGDGAGVCDSVGALAQTVPGRRDGVSVALSGVARSGGSKGASGGGGCRAAVAARRRIRLIERRSDCARHVSRRLPRRPQFHATEPYGLETTHAPDGPADASYKD
jgi:hypothetical protein